VCPNSDLSVLKNNSSTHRSDGAAVPAVAEIQVAIPPQNLITIEEMARRLRPDLPLEKGIAWVREKCRRRSPNPIPVYNLGRHLMFDWIQVSEWIRNLSRPIHAPHHRRKSTAKKLKVAA
jgi:hypothetical protein